MSEAISMNSRTSVSNSDEPSDSLASEFDGADDLLRAWCNGLRPDPLLTVSEWADRHRILSSRASAEPGHYRTDRTPYMRDIMDALSPSHPARRIVFMKAAQVGATEAGNNWIGYVIHHAPGPMLAVQPTVELAKRFSRQRIDPLVAESEALSERVQPARARDAGNTILSKEFPGGLLVLTGANSAVGLRSMPARYLFLDEADAYPPSADEEGDPVALAEARTRTFAWRSKIFLASTPTIQGLSRIERDYDASDQRRYFVPCPHCAQWQHLEFLRLRWLEGQPETAHYVCIECEEPIHEHHKTAMLGAGEWRATAEPKDPGTIGFHLSGLYSPVGWLSWVDIARMSDLAKTDEARRSFKNSVLGETWVERGEAPEWQRLYDRREDWPVGTIPADGLFLTAGADVQKDRIEALAIEAADASIDVLDCPVSGGRPRAAEGSLALICGGEPAIVERCRPVLEKMGTIFHCGPVGMGQVAKLANQGLTAAQFRLVQEVRAMAAAYGMDLDTLMDVVRSSTGASFIAENWSFLEPNWSHLGRLAKKDIDLCLAAGRDREVAMPLVEAASNLTGRSS